MKENFYPRLIQEVFEPPTKVQFGKKPHDSIIFLQQSVGLIIFSLLEHDLYIVNRDIDLSPDAYFITADGLLFLNNTARKTIEFYPQPLDFTKDTVTILET